MIVLRKISFWLALAGLFSTALLVRELRAQLAEPDPAPPVAPAINPFPAGAIGAAGLVEARRENTAVAAPVAGLVTRVHVAPWDEVAAGDPLFQLDDRDLAAQQVTLEAQIKVAAATLNRVSDQAARIAALGASGVVSTDQLETTRNEVRVAEAQLEAARAALATNALLQRRLTVVAPGAGTVLQVNLRAGEYTNPAAATPALLLGDLTRLQVRADVDEQIAPRVRAGAAAVGYLKGDAAHPIPLQFERIEPFVIPKRSLTGASTERVDTRVLQVIYSFTQPTDRAIYVGQQIDVFIADE